MMTSFLFAYEPQSHGVAVACIQPKSKHVDEKEFLGFGYVSVNGEPPPPLHPDNGKSSAFGRFKLFTDSSGFAG